MVGFEIAIQIAHLLDTYFMQFKYKFQSHYDKFIKVKVHNIK